MSISAGQKIIITTAADTEAKSEVRITPQLIQYLSVLQMNVAAFEAYIKGAVDENPMLELSWKDSQTVPFNYSGKSGEANNISDPLENSSGNSVPFEETLAFELRSQLEGIKKAQGLAELTYRLCQLYIDNIDDDGYLSADLVEQAAKLREVGRDAAEEALTIIQSMSPAGVGARDDNECIDIQKSREVPVNIRPGQLYSRQDAVQYVYPDIYIRIAEPDDEDDDIAKRIYVEIDSRHEPKLELSSQYLRMLEETTDAEAKAYLKEKKQHAEWVISCIEQRYRTLQSVAEAIAELQMDYLTDENAMISMITLSDVAKIAGVNESTVSRAIRDKYASTPRGTFPLPFFIPRARSSQAGTLSYADMVRMLIRRLIYNEDKAAPLSDRKIAEELEKAGYVISRRAITKYRKELGIPSTRQR
ncbi:MAG: LacI family DNA-binding transcriptional regulator [Mogibacterium sp.]|nr:LacI family DNA-binding transcriptional regulator [Mogibacterium sp.]